MRTTACAVAVKDGSGKKAIKNVQGMEVKVMEVAEGEAKPAARNGRQQARRLSLLTPRPRVRSAKARAGAPASWAGRPGVRPRTDTLL